MLENLFSSRFEVVRILEVGDSVFWVVKANGRAARRLSIVTTCPRCKELGKLVVTKTHPVTGRKYAIDHNGRKHNVPVLSDEHEIFEEVYKVVRRCSFE